MSEKIVLITGATDGIGKATAEELARRGFMVIIHGRNAAKVAQAQAEIRQKVAGAKLEGLTADFSSLTEVRGLSDVFLARFDRLDVLINNAGFFPKVHQLSADGFELSFAVNHLAHFLLTCKLLPMLRANRARVVTLSSISHRLGKIDFDDLLIKDNFDGYRAYARTKLANIYFSNELAERERGVVTSNSLHPGGVTTKLLMTGFNASGISVEKGAEIPVFLASAPEAASITGKYFSDGHEAPTQPPVLDAATGKRLWIVSEELTGVSSH